MSSNEPKESKISDAQRRALAKQATKRKQITLQLSLEQYEILKERADFVDKTIHGYVIAELFGKY